MRTFSISFLFIFFVCTAHAEESKLDKELQELVQAEEELIFGVKEEAKTDQDAVENIEVRLEKLEKDNSELKAKNEKLVKNFDRAVEGIRELKSQRESLQKELEKSKKEIEEKQKEQSKLEEGRESLQQEIVRLQNELLLRETEIKVLSGDKKAKKELEKILAKSGQKTREETSTQEIVSDVTIVEVIGNKVNIRSGAGKEHSPVMQVQKGTRLTVEAREGSWYRVFTPTGSRGYIKTSVVRKARAKKKAKQVGKNAATSSNSNNIEERALDRLRSNFR